MAADAICFGVPTLVIDIIPGQRRCLFRDFPDLCFSTAEQIVERLLALEDGTWVQPQAAYDSLVKISGPHFLDVIREDLGLGPKTCSEGAHGA